MKENILFFGAAIAIASNLYVQEIPQSQVPPVIVGEFNKQFPKATDFERQLDGTLYNSDFDTGWNIDHEVWYSAEGKMTKHKKDISKSQLPNALKGKI